MTPRKPVPPTLQLSIIETLTSLSNASVSQLLNALNTDINRHDLYHILLKMQNAGTITRSSNLRARSTWHVTTPRTTFTPNLNPAQTALHSIIAYLSAPSIHPADKVTTALSIAHQALIDSNIP